MTRSHAPLADRLWRRVDVGHPLGCWQWTGATTFGYGVIGLGTRTEGTDWTHRVAWRLLMGDIPDGMHLDHLCRNRACVNPDHLELVTPAENKRRGYSPAAKHARKTRCKNGHEFSSENTSLYTNPRTGRTSRRCKACRRVNTDRRAA